MKRLTTKRLWEEAKKDLENKHGYPVRIECHAHRKCLQTAIEIMKKQ